MSDRKGSSDVTGATVLFKVLYSKIKNAFLKFFVFVLCKVYFM